MKLLRKLRKQTHAVSPVIATLMLVLVSVGSAGAFYVWQSGWQSDSLEGVKGDLRMDSVSIAGSTTVYEFTACAAPMFEAQHQGYKIGFQGGGSGSGVASVGTGVVDIGSASRGIKASEHSQYPDLNGDGEKDPGQTIVEHTVALDAVALCISDAAPGVDLTGADAESWMILALYCANSGTPLTLAEYDLLNGSTTVGNYPGAGADDQYNWSEWTNLIGCTTPSTSTNLIVPTDRGTSSGTEDLFTDTILGIDEKQLEEIGIDTGNHYDSNQALLGEIQTDSDTIGFLAYGIAASNPTAVDVLQVEGFEPSEDTILDGDYCGIRPINYITVGEPTGDIKAFIDWCLMPETNLAICACCGYVSLYA